MSAKQLPTWPLPVMALVQVILGSGMAFTIKEPGGGWELEYALIDMIFVVPGLVIIGFGVRNCVRLWRVQAWEASWALIVSLLVTGLFGGLVATGPLTIGEWRWSSLVTGLYVVYLMVVMVRELRRLRAWSRRPLDVARSEPTSPHYPT